ncbi:replication protein O of bacteriophage [Alteromonas macleodii str. 'Black Sea 11']|nr:replication protein O of bacteriophage [Alteromonas macleodii str. 'Black Sea 11']
MTHAEITALLDPSLSSQAKTLYLALRYCCDFKTGVAKASYSKLAQLCTYEPPAKSKEETIVPTRKQLRHLITKLEKADLIVKLEAGNATTGTVAKWSLPLVKGNLTGAAQNNPTGAAQSPVNTGDAELTGAAQKDVTGAQEGPKRGRAQGPRKPHANKGLQPQQGPRQNPQQGPISGISDKYIYINGTEQNFDNGLAPIKASELQLDQEMVSMARLVGLVTPLENLQLIFIDFTSHKNKRHLVQTKADWLADWRGWCAKAKLYNAGVNTNANNSRPYQPSQQPKNATAKVLSIAKRRAANGGFESDGFE